MQTPRPLGTGRYELIDVLGEGGMATVFRARDTQLDCERALKLLDPSMTRGPLRKRFILEAQTMARLHHPNLVAVHDVHADDPVYMVMELMVGSVHRWLSRHGPMPPPLAVDVIRQVLAGLGHAHEQGIVHRDVKPQNILVSPTGVIQLTDFGIAQVKTGPQLTRTGAVMGTYAYMAPEQRTSSKHVDARADVYSVGATLYALLTDLEPSDLFATETHKGRFGSLAPGLIEVVVRACSYSPDERFQSAQDMDAALSALELGRVPPGTPDVTDCVRRKPRETAVESMISDAESGSSEVRANPTISTAPEDPNATADDEPSIMERPPTRSTPMLWVAVAGLLAGAGGVAWWSTQEDPQPERPEVPATVEDTPIAEPLPVVDEVVEVPVEVVEDPPVEPVVREETRAPVVVEAPEVVPQEPSRPGRLVVNSKPWGYVSVDGGPRHRTTHAVELPAGAHTLTLTSNDNRDATVQVDVPSGGELVYCYDYNKGGDC